MIRIAAVTGALTIALTGIAGAQSAPVAAPSPAASAAPAGQPWLANRAAFALRAAYRTIGIAETRGASPYLDAAKEHYRDALARLGRHDAGAPFAAAAAVALARAAIAEHPLPAPRDIPAPPALAERPWGGAPGDGAPGDGPRPWGRPGMGPGPRPHRPRGGFDAAALARDAALAGTAEAKDLAQKAVDADVARTRAEFSGTRVEAQRQGRLAGALAQAVRALARVEHPPALRARGRLPAGRFEGQNGGFPHPQG
jgi:hypothetical protein